MTTVDQLRDIQRKAVEQGAVEWLRPHEKTIREKMEKAASQGRSSISVAPFNMVFTRSGVVDWRPDFLLPGGVRYNYTIPEIKAFSVLFPDIRLRYGDVYRSTYLILSWGPVGEEEVDTGCCCVIS